MAPAGTPVFATLLMNDAYLPGAMVLGHSLKDKKAKAKLVAFVVIERLANSTISELKTVWDEVIPVQQIVNRTPANLYLMDRPDLISTFTKIELWRQTQYSRIVYLDADMVAIRAPNELLTMDTHFAAVPDIGWPDCFNSGLLVLNPNMQDYYALLALAERGISFDGADQGLLNMHFEDWERLSFTYNCTPSGNYQYVPAYRHFQSSINVVHFIGRDKPWRLGRSGKFNSGVYGELLARWWAVYDRHYRGQETVFYTGNYQETPKKVQDYVVGEETIYLPSRQAPTEPQQASNQVPKSNQNPPTIAVHPPPGDPLPAVDTPLGDQPQVEEQIRNDEYTPTPTVEQRRWSAPHVDWEPARAPPPTNSKPEAANFPATTYEMSESRDLFRPPATYPEAPKGMWYEVPAKVTPPSKPKPIFPWEAKAPKPTRVFVEPKLPSPPPEPELPPAVPEAVTETEPSVSGESDTSSAVPVEPAKEPYVDPWTTFSQRTNAWDDMPEIARYMQALTQTKKGKIQVLHHTPSTRGPDDVTSPPLSGGRRDSVKVTDFPTAIERPSLPVTPAPIRRSNYFVIDKEEASDLPVAEGVPKQEEWVRRFSAYPTPAFASLPPLLDSENDVLCFRCQYCGKQNPIAKLEDLQRRQSEILLAKQLELTEEPPRRDMPESKSKEEVVKATEKALTPPAKVPLKPILKEPSFELPKKDDTNSLTAAKDLDAEQELDPKAPGVPKVIQSLQKQRNHENSVTTTASSTAAAAVPSSLQEGTSPTAKTTANSTSYNNATSTTQVGTYHQAVSEPSTSTPGS